MEELLKFLDVPLIKIINGVRRSGKSTLLALLAEELKKRGIQEERIIYRRYTALENSGVNDASSMYKELRDKTAGKEHCYLLLDEVQEVDGWERAVNSLFEDDGHCLYVTGSNSRMLSSELSTYLTGRYVSIHVMPLSFKECLQFHGISSCQDKEVLRAGFTKYLRSGGFPAVHTAEYDYEAIYRMVYDIYSSVILRDTVQRHGIRNVELLERVVKFTFDNIGNRMNAKNIADYFKSQQGQAHFLGSGAIH